MNTLYIYTKDGLIFETSYVGLSADGCSLSFKDSETTKKITIPLTNFDFIITN
jgi:hypothetical protein